MISSGSIVSLVRELEKYRMKLILTLLCPVVFSVVFYFFSDEVLMGLSNPLGGESLYFVSPVEGITVKIRLAIYGGFVFAAPPIIYSAVAIFGKKLKTTIKRKIILIYLPVSAVAMAGGMFFGYRLVIPAAVSFLISCGKDVMTPMIIGSSYVSFTVFILVAMGLVFEFPLVIVALSRIGVLNAKTLAGKRKYAIMGILVVSAFITPTPDAFTMLLVAAPLYLLYETSIWWILILERIQGRKVLDTESAMVGIKKG